MKIKQGQFFGSNSDHYGQNELKLREIHFRFAL